MPDTPSTMSTMSPSSPTSKKSNRYQDYHQYPIQSTSSSLLSRYPPSAQPPPNTAPSLAHRSSRSMSSLHALTNGRESTPSTKEKEEDRRRSMDSPSVRRGKGRRGETLTDWRNASNHTGKSKEIDIPPDPNQWTPSELSQYLTQELCTGGPDGSGKVLPVPLVRDIESWVLRQRVTGSIFMNGSADGWGSSTSRAPPFIPLLQSIARRLRRTSTNPSSRSSHFPRSPSLREEDESGLYDEDEPNGVRRMVIAYDARSSSSASSASDAGEDDRHEFPRLVAQHTGESVIERWKRWEETGALIRPSDHEEYVQGYGRKRTSSDASEMSKSSAGSSMGGAKSPTMKELLLQSGDAATEDGAYGDGTIKAVPSTTVGPPTLPLNGIGVTTPDTSTASNSSYLTPENPLERGKTSVTPTPERPKPTGNMAPVEPSANDESQSETTPSKANHSRQPSDGARYASLGISSRRRHPWPVKTFLEDIGVEEGREDDIEGRWEIARRVTLRPTKPVISSSKSSVPAEQEGERGAGELVAKLMERIDELEKKLETVSASGNAVSPPDEQAALPQANFSLMNFLWLGKSNQDHDLPVRVRELPVYLFLVGIGVGAVMVKVLLGRNRA